MPELPEVETVRRGVASHLIGERIVGAKLHREDILEFHNTPESTLNWARDFLTGSEIFDVGRLGKFILMQTASGGGWAIHLGMSGTLTVGPVGDVNIYKHSHVVLETDGGLQVVFTDPRRFGCWMFVTDDNPRKVVGQRVGRDALDSDLQLENFKDLIGHSDAMIKSRLLDQRLIAGLGNIYVDEILFRAGVHPKCPASKLEDDKWQKLYTNMKETLLEAIENRGTTFSSYRDAGGRAGENARYLLVYGKEGEDCPECQQTIRKIQVAGRGTHFCPDCQRLKEKTEVMNGSDT